LIYSVLNITTYQSNIMEISVLVPKYSNYVQAKNKIIEIMKRVIELFIGLAFILNSCDKNDNEKSFNSTVISIGVDCGDSYLIKFNEDISGPPENSFDNTFYEINLPDEFKIEGKKIYVEFREPEDEELMVCTTMGLGYAQIYITKVE